MPLSPKHLYSTRVYAEILSAIGARMVELMGHRVALGVFSRVARPVGERDAKMLARVLGVKGGNAASAAVVTCAAASILDLDTAPVRLDAGFSQLRTNRCVYGDAVLRYKDPLVCALCHEYNKGMAAFFGAKFAFDEAHMISAGYGSCIANFEYSDPSRRDLPGRARTDFGIKLLKLVSNKNTLLVSTLSSLLVGLGGRASRILGSAALVPARAAFGAGVYQAPVFSRVLGLSGGLGDGALLVSGVREALGCAVRANFSGGGFSLVTEKCPQASHCSAGSFLEVACVSYSRGLLSKWGDFEVRSDIRSGVCRQGFVVRVAQPVVGAVSGAGFVARGKAKRGSVFGGRAKRGSRKSAAAKGRKVR